MTRTFIALELNEALQRFLAEIISKISHELPDLRWVDPSGIHLTLAFLGGLSDDQLVEAIHASEKAAKKATSFQYCLKGLNIFGSPRQPRVIWMGVEDVPSGKVQGSPLQHVHRVLAKELELRGFEVEKRPFSPHLTLARIKQPLSPDAQQRLQRLLHSKVARSTSAIYPVSALYVMKSELSRAGAKYTCLKECAFSKSSSSLS